MKAVIVSGDQLTIGEHDEPVVGAGEVKVRVRATALNRADLMQRAGKYPPPPGVSEILGLEMAGEIIAVGSGVDQGRIGERVCGLLSGGGYAQYVTLHERMALPIPGGLSYEAAAAIPEVFMTAYQALFWLGDLRPDDRVLIHAGASGVGTAATQLARWRGARVYVTASASKHAACLELGAAAAIDYRNEDFAARIAALTDGVGVHVVVDFIGAPYLAANLDALARDGRIVLLAMMGGARAEAFDLRAMFKKRARLITSTLRSRDLAYKIALATELRDVAWAGFEDGALRPVIDRVYSWHEVEAAHQRMADNANIGKLVLRVED